MRDHTERPEAVKSGTVKLNRANKSNIIEEIEKLLNNKKAYIKMSKAHNPYCDGRSSYKIIKFFIS